jgi:hypothetical protein
MSETGIPGSADSMPSGAQGAGSKIDSTTGKRVGRAAPPGQNQAEQVATFMREEPLAAALIALIIGYILGKIT